jgi:hypothetical protein
MLSMTRRLLSSNANRFLARQTFFSWSRHDVGALLKDTDHKPHTSGYLQDQKKICDQYKLPSKFVTIPAGTRLNFFIISGDLLLGAVAVYPKDSLTKLTEKEFAKIRSWPGNHLSEVEVTESIDCISLEETNGRVVYYIYPGKFDILNSKSVEECVSNRDLAPRL